MSGSPLFLPRGLNPGEVPDPSELARDFIEAARVCQDTTQWQWLAGAFADVDELERGTIVDVEHANVGCELGVVPGVAGNVPILPDTGGADADLFKIPYNTGFHPILDQNSDALEVSWASQYPELLFIINTYQYVRRSYGSSGFNNANIHIRMQMRIEVDGVRLPGAGPFCIPFDGKYRGMGYGVRGLRTADLAIWHVPAGAHTVRPVVAQAPMVRIDDSDKIDQELTADNPTDGVCIGSRRLIVVRFGRGVRMGS